MMIRGLMLKASLISKRQLHVISRSITNIKPASTTPLELKQYNFPFHDRMTPDFYVPIICFYPNPQSVDSKTTISDLLKNSLSKTLSRYYPFAGRLSSSGSYVDCNDAGVEFVEARMACKLSEILEKAPVREEEEGFGHLFPLGTIWQNVLNSRLLVVQLNHFSCGGIAIAVSLSHRIADGVTTLTFLSYWASLLRNSNDQEKQVHPGPCFVQELLPESSCNSQVIQFSAPKKNWTTKEILFHNSKIAELKANQVMQDKQRGLMNNQNYSRNELVTALLYRCAVVAAATSNSGVCPKSVLFQPVNMRSLIDPPLPQTSVGNLFTFNHTPTNTMAETQFKPLVTEMRKGRMQLKGLKSLEGKDIFPLMGMYVKMNYHKLYSVSSLCNFPLYEEMDFGWGRPVKATVVDAPLLNTFVMMDAPSGDGINVIMGLEDQDMKNILVNKELLAYASF